MIEQVTVMTRWGVLLTSLTLVAGCATLPPRIASEEQRKIKDLNERALLSADQGHMLDSHKLLDEAVRRAYALDDQDSVALTSLNQSRLARHRGDLKTAVESANRAVKLGTASNYYADAAQEMALIELSGNRFNEALRWAELSRNMEKGRLVGRRLNLLARIHLLIGNLDVAEQFANEGLKASERGDLYAEQANALRMLGNIYIKRGQFIKAGDTLNQALLRDKSLADSDKIAADLEALAELSKREGNEQKFAEYAQRARMVRENLRKKGVTEGKNQR